MDEVKEGLFEETKLRHRLAMAESSMEQNNFSLTLRIMKETHPVWYRWPVIKLLNLS